MAAHLCTHYDEFIHTGPMGNGEGQGIHGVHVRNPNLFPYEDVILTAAVMNAIPRRENEAINRKSDTLYAGFHGLHSCTRSITGKPIR